MKIYHDSYFDESRIRSCSEEYATGDSEKGKQQRCSFSLAKTWTLIRIESFHSETIKTPYWQILVKPKKQQKNTKKKHYRLLYSEIFSVKLFHKMFYKT